MSRVSDSMEQVTSLQALKDLIRENKSRFGKTETNCMLMIRSLEPYIQQGRLYTASYDQGIALYADEGTYYELYYYWNPQAPFSDFSADKPVSVVQANFGGKPEADRTAEAKLLAAGFRILKDTCQVEMDPCDPAHPLEEMFAVSEAGMAQNGLVFQYADGSRMAEAVPMWREYLDLADVPLDHTVLQPEDKMLCVVDAHGRLAATHWWRHSGKASEGRHTVTHPAFYRKGLATAMLLAWCLDARKQGVRKAFTWIRTTNSNSLGLYRKVGFVPNGRMSRQYILN